jgi:hypothetical protein
MFQIKVVEKIKMHISCAVTSFRKSSRLWDNVENCCGAREAASLARWISKATRAKAHVRTRTPTPTSTPRHALTHASKQTHTYTTEMCNNYCFSTTTMVSWTCLIVTLCIHCLSCCHSDTTQHAHTIPLTYVYSRRKVMQGIGAWTRSIVTWNVWRIMRDV